MSAGGVGPLVDAGFRCHHCITPIGEDMPVYMRKDASYCSVECRRRGQSARHFQLMGGRSPDAPDDLVRTVSMSNASTLSSTISDTAWSSSAGSDRATPDGKGRGLLGWILNVGLRKIASIVKGTELLRTISGSVLWGADRPLVNLLSRSGEQPWDSPSELGAAASLRLTDGPSL